ncbi:GNAT family N-acetyltransferase [Adhaeribacter aquaticus]|uniref:GNAT family N-acetyltransferase n=1 Tax=Adhaeribacter aquaticus TaxID=299567 RepID=UPI0004122225|nr:GNAT family N-acetyltransferase [Adhaeribacter aquaticus]
MKTSFSVRVATASDNELLAQLGWETFEAAFGAANTPEDMAAYLPTAFNPSLQAAELNDPQTIFWIISVQEAVVGYIKFYFGPAPACITSSNQMKIARLYLLPKWCGKGLGTELLKQSFDFAKKKECKVIWLTVWEHNTGALALYQKYGFKIVGDEDFVLGQDVQHDFIMEKVF